MAKGPISSKLIVCDNSTHQIVIFDHHYQHSDVITGVGSKYGQFEDIIGIVTDKKGHLYVADSQLHCILKFKLANGQYVSQIGHKGDGIGQFLSPGGLALSQSGLLFVCDRDNNRIQIFQDGVFHNCFGRKGKEPSAFIKCRDLTLNNSEDRLFVTDRDNHRVQIFTTCRWTVLNRNRQLDRCTIHIT